MSLEDNMLSQYGKQVKIINRYKFNKIPENVKKWYKTMELYTNKNCES